MGMATDVVSYESELATTESGGSTCGGSQKSGRFGQLGWLGGGSNGEPAAAALKRAGLDYGSAGPRTRSGDHGGGNSP